MEAIYIHSRPIDPAYTAVASNGLCFTTLPVRISKYTEIVDEAAQRCLRDWGEHIGDGRDKTSRAGVNDHGNFNAFMCAESLPERLGIVTYVNELAFLDDGT
jgi:hypothetical protein